MQAGFSIMQGFFLFKNGKLSDMPEHHCIFFYWKFFQTIGFAKITAIPPVFFIDSGANLH